MEILLMCSASKVQSLLTEQLLDASLQQLNRYEQRFSDIFTYIIV
jgi:hypothetical protein